jgi:hypothetical protein
LHIRDKWHLNLQVVEKRIIKIEIEFDDP